MIRAQRPDGFNTRPPLATTHRIRARHDRIKSIKKTERRDSWPVFHQHSKEKFAMTASTTRRALILAGAATLPALSLPTLALPAMAGQQSDRELVALEREIEAAHARMMEASKVSSEASERYEAMRPPKPAEPQQPEGYEELLKTITVGQLGVLPADHPIVVWNRETVEHRRAIHRKHSAKCRRLERKCGVNIAEKNFAKRVDELWEIAGRIFATQAHTIDGMKIKLRIVKRLEIDESNLGDAWASLEKDIRALSVA
jgi:hypothetical protein